MKKIVLGFCALTLVFMTSCKEDASSKIKDENVAQAAERDSKSTSFPVIEFNKTEHDFGDIKDGQAVETVFSYKNVGDSPLVVTDIKSTCGCTVPSDWSRQPLAPGESSQFTVKFNGKGNGITSKTITLTANTERGKEMVKIKANVDNPNMNRANANGQTIQSLQAQTPVRTSTQPGHEGHNHN